MQNNHVIDYERYLDRINLIDRITSAFEDVGLTRVRSKSHIRNPKYTWDFKSICVCKKPIICNAVYSDPETHEPTVHCDYCGRLVK